MVDYHDDYNRFYDLYSNLNKENIQDIPIIDLRAVALMQRDKINMLIDDKQSLNKRIKALQKSSKVPVYIDIPDFVAIDFETATTDRMACSLGIVVVNDYKISQEFYYLIQPPGNNYHQNCINLHKIDPSKTEKQPTFDEVWLNISHHFNNIIVTHNAAFDLDVLKVNCRYYGIIEPDINSICTYELHNKTGLEDACGLYDITLHRHHDALEDARACAKLFIKYQQIHKVTCLLDRPAAKTQKKKNEDFFSDPGRRLSKDVLKQDLSIVENKDNIFYNKKVVITGVLDSFPVREDLANRLKLLGADINTSISKNTDIVICGKDCGPAKIKKVQELREAGFNIILLEESELLEKLSL